MRRTNMPRRTTKKEKPNLRQQAEKRLRQAKPVSLPPSEKDPQHLLDELTVHQTELEIQNEDLKQTQQELLAARDRYTDLFEFAPIGYLTLDKNNVILEANLTFCRMLGLSRSNVLKQRFTIFISPENQDIFYLTTLQIRQKNSQKIIELSLKKADGLSFIAQLSIICTTEDSLRLAVVDVTEREQAEEALKESQKKYQALIETTSDFIWETDAQGRYTYCSPQMKRLWGYEPREMLGKTPFDFMAPEDREQSTKAFMSIAGAQRPFAGMGVNSLDSQGHPITIEISGVPYFDAGGKFSGYRGVSRDITQRKQVEEALKVSEEKYRSVVDNANEVIIVAQDGLIKFVGGKALPLTGYSHENLESKPFTDIIYPADRKAARERHQKRMRGEAVPDVWEFRVLGKDGIVRWAQSNTANITWEKRPASLVFLNNITARKEAEEALVRANAELENKVKKRTAELAESEGKYRSLVETTTDFIWEVDKNGAYTYVSPKIFDMLGYKPEEVIGKTPFDLMPSEEAERILKIFREYVSQESPFNSLENINCHKDGHRVVLETSGVPFHDAKGRFQGYRGIDRDITQRKKAEEELKESEEKYRMVFTQAPDSIVIIDVEKGKLEQFNSSAHKNLGYTREEFEKLKISDFEVVESDKEVASHIQKIVQEGSGIFETKQRTKSGLIRDVQINARAIRIRGKQYLHSIWRDITERKQMEEALAKAKDELEIKVEERTQELRESEEKYRMLVDNASETIMIVQDGIIKFTGGKAVDLTGFPLEALVNMPFLDYLNPEDRRLFLERDIRRKRGEAVPASWEFRILHKDGGIRWALSNSTSVTWEKRPAVLSLLTNITERKQAEEALKESEKKYRALVENASEVIVVVQDGLIKFMNKRGLEPTGYSPEEMTGKSFLELVYPDDRMGLADLYGRHMAGQIETTNYEFRIIPKDSGTRWALMNAANILWEGRPAILAICTDITDRKKAEDALTESEARANALIEYAPAGIYEIDIQGTRFIRVNDAVSKITGYSHQELLAMNPTKLLEEESRMAFAEMVRRKLAGEKVPDTADFKARKKDGTLIYVSLQASFSQTEPGVVFVIAHDITERKMMERELEIYARRVTEVQEEERKRIAYELHDDTAQYLSILKMQLGSVIDSGKIEDPQVLEKLQYLEKDAGRAFEDIRRYSHELRPVTLERMGLMAALEQVADDHNKLGQINVNLKVGGAEPVLEEEVKLGFFRIAQEALNNVRKHAKASLATITLTFQENRLDMLVSDNGNGFDVKEAAARAGGKGSLGLMSMRERANLIGASLNIESKPGRGTNIRVEVPL